MKCFYHKSDLDGHCSGAIVKYLHAECKLLGVDYKDSIKQFEIEENEAVYVVDFSFSREEMSWLNKHTQLTWIDHHKSAIEKCSGLIISGVQEVGRAGCELTWEHCFYDEFIPEAVRLLGRYDVWDHEDPDVLPFQYGMRQNAETRPEHSMELWADILERAAIGLYDIIDTGRTIIMYEEKQNKIYAQGMAYEVDFEGCRAIVMNKAYANSKAFDSVYNSDKHDIMILFGVKPGEIKYTLFCDKPEIDVSLIAGKYGGGGHKGAAGFYSDTILF